MGKAGTGDMEMRRIGVVDGGEQLAVFHQRRAIHRRAETLRRDDAGQRAAGICRFDCQRVDARGAVHHPGDAVVGRPHGALACGVDELDQMHVVAPSFFGGVPIARRDGERIRILGVYHHRVHCNFQRIAPSRTSTAAGPALVGMPTR